MSNIPNEAQDPASANANTKLGTVGMEIKGNTVEFSKEMKEYKIADMEDLVNEENVVRILAYDGGREQVQKADNEQQK